VPKRILSLVNRTRVGVVGLAISSLGIKMPSKDQKDEAGELAEDVSELLFILKL